MGSKSLKQFRTSFRKHGALHDECTALVGRRIARAIKPLWLRVGGYRHPRGGIPIDVFWQTGAPPEGAWLRDTGVAPLPSAEQPKERQPLVSSARAAGS